MLRRGDRGLAAGVLTEEPPRTGSAQFDAAFAALAEYLADPDGWPAWPAPVWMSDPSRRTEEWYPAMPASFRADADQESPDAFRRRSCSSSAQRWRWPTKPDASP